MAPTKLTVINEDEKVTTYELARILDTCAAALRELPLSIIRNVEGSEEMAFARLRGIAIGLNNQLATLEASIELAESTAIEAADRHYKRTSELIKNLNARLAALPKIDDHQHLHYNAKEVLELAERMERLDEATWLRVIQFAVVLTGHYAPSTTVAACPHGYTDTDQCPDCCH